MKKTLPEIDPLKIYGLEPHYDVDGETAIQLGRASKSHKEWLDIMQFGRAQLVIDRYLLTHCIVEEIVRERDRGERTDETFADSFVEMMEELDVTFKDDLIC